MELSMILESKNPALSWLFCCKIEECISIENDLRLKMWTLSLKSASVWKAFQYHRDVNVFNSKYFCHPVAASESGVRCKIWDLMKVFLLTYCCAQICLRCFRIGHKTRDLGSSECCSCTQEINHIHHTLSRWSTPSEWCANSSVSESMWLAVMRARCTYWCQHESVFVLLLLCMLGVFMHACIHVLLLRCSQLSVCMWACMYCFDMR